MSEFEIPDRLMTPAELARLFNVSSRTVARWVRDGRIAAVRTPGGRHAFRPEDVRSLVAESAA